MDNLYQSSSYKNIVKQNAYNILNFLIQEDVDFLIITYTNVIDFNPPIPKDIIEFDKTALFTISGYTKESAKVDKNSFIIEAGFGKEGFGSTLTIPLEAIIQIVFNEETLHINYHKPKKIVIKNSMEALLNNPENQKLLKKKITKK
jgi:hypothetical protein